MRNFRALLYCAALLLMALMVTGCSSESKEGNAGEDKPVMNSKTDGDSSQTDVEDKDKDESESAAETDNPGEDKSAEDASSESENDQANEEVSKNDDDSSEGEVVDLSQYSSEEIEYARVWYQLGPNQQIDKLYVTKIPAGSPINPKHEDVSATYPEDVIMLKGTRVVDGAVTYSGNGDGTINVYKVPARWDEKLGVEVDKGEIKRTTEKVAKETKRVKIDSTANQEIVNLIQKIDMNE